MASAADRRPLRRRAKQHRDLRGWVTDHRVVMNVQTWLMLVPVVAALLVVAAAGPERMCPAPLRASALVSWPWLLLWCALAAALAGNLVVWRRPRRWGRDVRDMRVDSLSGAMSLAEDILLVGSFRHEPLWCTVAVQPLTALIYTASSKGNGLGWSWLSTMTAGLGDANSAAGWHEAAAAVGDVDHELRRWFSHFANWDPRQRVSVGITIRDAVADYLGALR
jgi:hypothetical protein